MAFLYQYQCPSLVTAWQQFMGLAYYEAFVQSGEFGLPVAGSIVDYQGRWAVQFTINEGTPSEEKHVWIATDSPSDETVDLRLIMMQSGFSTATLMNWVNADVTDLYAPYDVLFSQLVEDTKIELITTCTDGEIVLSSTDAVDSPDGFRHDVMVTVVAKNDHGLYATTDRGQIYWNETDPEFITGGPVGVDAFQTQPVAGVMASLAPLTSAVNAITDQDMEISFNQGAFVFSIKSKVLVT